MDILKTPHEKLMEQAGMQPASPGWLNSPQQMMVDQSNVVPHLAGGGQPNMSPQDMLAMLVAQGHLPQHFAAGGRPSIAELFKQIPQKQAEYKKEQEANAQGAADYYNKPLDPYFQNIIDSASRNNMDSIYDQANPAPTFQAQPTTATSWTRDQFAKAIGETPADRLFGTGSEGQKPEYLPLQLLNPVSQVTDTMGAVPDVAHKLQEGKVGQASTVAGLTALGAAPFAGPLKKIIKKIKHK